MREPARHTRARQLAGGAREVAAIPRWRTGLRPEPAHCLARVYLPASGPPTAILSELMTNERSQSVTRSFAAAADALLSVLAPFTAVAPETIAWFAHHGGFSSYEAAGAPETFTSVPLAWDGDHYVDDVDLHRLLGPAEAESLVAAVPLEPVTAVLDELDWPYSTLFGHGSPVRGASKTGSDDRPE